jgi:hypothetical protein
MKDLGFEYKRKRDEQIASAPDVITSTVAGEAVMAAWKRKPNAAKFRRSKLFSELYDEVFSPDLQAAHVILSVLAFRLVENERKRPKQKRPKFGRVDGGRGGCRSRELLFPAAFALLPVPQSRPWLRFPPPLIELDVQISRIQLSDGLHERACTGLRRRRVLRISTTPTSPNTSA